MASTKIYTRTGDRGQTSLIGGARVSKSSLRLDAYGTLDELNSHIGVMLEAVIGTNPKLGANVWDFLSVVQNHLFDIGSQLACEDDKLRTTLPTINDADIKNFETEMDTYSKELPALKNFVLPGGSRAGAQAHVARTVCRRAERICVALMESEAGQVDPILIRYLNRLSDYLFVLARHLNRLDGAFETLWKPKKS